MTTKTFIKVKKGKEEEWSWEETPEVRDAIAKYWAGVQTRQYWSTAPQGLNDKTQ